MSSWLSESGAARADHPAKPESGPLAAGLEQAAAKIRATGALAEGGFKTTAALTRQDMAKLIVCCDLTGEEQKEVSRYFAAKFANPEDHAQDLEAAARRIGWHPATLDLYTDLVLEFRRDMAARPKQQIEAIEAYARGESTPGEGAGRGKKTRQFTLPEPREWPEAIAAADLLPRMIAAIRTYVAIGDDGAMLAALWALHTHALDAFAVSPRFLITSAEAASGKSTLLDVLTLLAARGVQVNGASESAMLGALRSQPSLLIDDGNAVLGANAGLRNLIRSGYRRAGAQMLRIEGSAAQCIPVWTPVAVALTGVTPPFLCGRSIEIRLDRRRGQDRLTRLRPETAEPLIELGVMAVRWAKDHIDDLRASERAMPDLCGEECWTPLLVIAADAGPEWERHTRLAMESARIAAGSTSAFIAMLRDIRAILNERSRGLPELRGPAGHPITDRDRIRSADLAMLLAAIEGGPWREWGPAHQPLTAHGLAKLLSSARIRPAAMRFQTSDPNGAVRQFIERGYFHAQFTEAFARYLPASIPDAASSAG